VNRSAARQATGSPFPAEHPVLNDGSEHNKKPHGTLFFAAFAIFAVYKGL
jgi:hypothetical protein